MASSRESAKRAEDPSPDGVAHTTFAHASSAHVHAILCPIPIFPVKLITDLYNVGGKVLHESFASTKCLS